MVRESLESPTKFDNRDLATGGSRGQELAACAHAIEVPRAITDDANQITYGPVQGSPFFQIARSHRFTRADLSGCES